MKKILVVVVSVIILVVIICVYYFYNNQKLNIDIRVNNYYTLKSFYYNGDFNKFYEDSYNWYKSIENEEGVYIINTSYISEEILNIWRENNVYNVIPNNAFWEFTASPSYLKEINISINQDELNDALNGVRLYLIPDTLSDDEFEIMKAYLEETALYKVEQSNIKTKFVENKEVKFIKYSPSGNYFTWQSEKGTPIIDDSPIIYVCTSENMKYFESESLIATGVDSYIKFRDIETMEKFAQDDFSKEYNLTFSTTEKIYKNAAKNKLVDRKIDKLFE